MKVISIAVLCFLANICYSQVIINEIQASNSSTIMDNFGQYDDWIELYNTSDTVIDIGGLVLKDNVDIWQIPLNDSTTKLSPKSYFLLWADDDEAQGKFHTNFKLSATNGEFLGLYRSDSVTVIEFVNFPPTSDNQSYGKCNNTWMVFNNATPLKANDCLSSRFDNTNNKEPFVYPTITNALVNVKLPDNSGSRITLQILTTDGRLVLNRLYEHVRFAIDLSDLSNNMYFLHIYTNKEKYTRKIVKTS